MNHSGLARITKAGFHLSADLLEPLSVRNGYTVWWMYYPNPHMEPKIDYEHDFMVTPIPHLLWPYVARIKVRMKHKPGALAAIAGFLNSKRLNILTTHCSRSGHRYVTWTLILDVEHLHETNPITELSVLERVSTELERSIKDVKTTLHRKFVDTWLFTDYGPRQGTPPVSGEPIAVLSYFYEIWLKHQAHQGRYGVFEAICQQNMVRINQNHQEFLQGIIALLPTIGFAETDTRHASLRIIVLPRDKLNKFAQVKLIYRRERQALPSQSPNHSSAEHTPLFMSTRGLQAVIYEELHDKYNVWSVSSNTKHVDRDSDKGSIELLLESLKQPTSWEAMRQKLESDFRSIQNILPSKKMPELELKLFNVRPLPGATIFISIKTNYHHRDEYVNYCKEEGADIGILEDQYQVVDTNMEPISAAVSEKLKISDGLIQFYMSDHGDSDMRWLEVEYYAAHVLNMPRVRILDISREAQMLPMPTTDKDHCPISVDDPGSEEMRKKIRSALSQLLKEIQRVEISSQGGMGCVS